MNRRRGDQGASLFLVIGFMALVGGILGGLLPFITTGLGAATSVEQLRRRQYAADAAVEEAIAKVRNIGGLGPARQPCGPFTKTHDGIAIRVDCTNRLGILVVGGAPIDQRNVIFTACPDTGAVCAEPDVIVRAQVNYDQAASFRTYIVSWSVNR